MGRHSAPSDDDSDDLVGGVDLLSLDEADDTAVTGRHLRIAEVLPPDHTITFAGPPPVETAAERTASIPVAEIESAAHVDAGLAPVTDLPAAELLPILPGEAVAPPPVEPAATDDGAAAATGASVTADAPTPEARQHRETLLHRGAHASAADLAMLRSDASLRNRCIGAFLAPFVLYAVVLVVVGASARHWLIWIWAPTILACVAAGSLLDVAHKDVATAPDVPVLHPAEMTGPIEAIGGLDVSPAELTGPVPLVHDDPGTDGLDAEEPEQEAEAEADGSSESDGADGSSDADGIGDRETPRD